MGTTEPVPSPSPGRVARTVDEIADELAARLGETERSPRKALRRAVRILGPDRVQALLERTLDIERTGGLPLPDGSRRRTPGGVFFYLIRKTVTRKEATRILRPYSAPPPVQAREETQEQESASIPAANG